MNDREIPIFEDNGRPLCCFYYTISFCTSFITAHTPTLSTYTRLRKKKRLERYPPWILDVSFLCEQGLQQQTGPLPYIIRMRAPEFQIVSTYASQGDIISAALSLRRMAVFFFFTHYSYAFLFPLSTERFQEVCVERGRKIGIEETKSLVTDGVYCTVGSSHICCPIVDNYNY